MKKYLAILFKIRFIDIACYPEGVSPTMMRVGFGLFAIGLPLLAFISAALIYPRIHYRFFTDYLEYEEGFWTLERCIVSYKHIREVKLSQGVLQASREYRQERLALARDLSAREDWGQAYQLLEDTGDRAAEPEPVNSLLAQLREREARALRERLNQW